MLQVVQTKKRRKPIQLSTSDEQGAQDEVEILDLTEFSNFSLGCCSLNRSLVWLLTNIRIWFPLLFFPWAASVVKDLWLQHWQSLILQVSDCTRDTNDMEGMAGSDSVSEIQESFSCSICLIIFIRYHFIWKAFFKARRILTSHWWVAKARIFESLKLVWDMLTRFCLDGVSHL